MSFRSLCCHPPVAHSIVWDGTADRVKFVMSSSYNMKADWKVCTQRQKNEPLFLVCVQEM